jgi:hypothetical protein
MNRIFAILLMVAAVIGGAFWYVHWSKERAMNNGEVFVRDQPEENTKPAAAPAPVAAVGEPAPLQEVATGGAAAPSGQQTHGSAEPNTPAVPVASAVRVKPARAVPVSDTLSRNPPNGMRIASSGRYQLYRQGDITWRLNTETGDACILLATDAQWQKARVYENGCGGA